MYQTKGINSFAIKMEYSSSMIHHRQHIRPYNSVETELGNQLQKCIVKQDKILSNEVETSPDCPTDIPTSEGTVGTRAASARQPLTRAWAAQQSHVTDNLPT